MLAIIDVYTSARVCTRADTHTHIQCIYSFICSFILARGFHHRGNLLALSVVISS